MEDRGEQILFGAEVTIERFLGHAEATREVAQRRGAVAARAEQLGGGNQDLRAGLRAAGGAPRGAQAQW